VAYKIQSRPDYSEELLYREARIPVRYYGRQQMKILYPHCNFVVAGEIGGKTGAQYSVAETSAGQVIPVCRENTHNIMTETVAGYAAVDRHTYLAVIKNALPKRIVVAILALILIAGAAVVFAHIH
jgi:hypothetical protein